MEKSEHGKVTSNRTNASNGSTVTLTVTPDSGYVLDALTVTDSRAPPVPSGTLPFHSSLLKSIWYEERKGERMPVTVENRYLCLTMARCCIQHQEYQKAYDLMGRLLGPLRAQGRVLDVIEALLLSSSATCSQRYSPLS